MPFCDSCGNKINETARFCSNCGKGITQEEFTQQPSQSASLSNQKLQKVHVKKTGYIKYVLIFAFLICAFLTKPSFRDHKNNILEEVIYPLVDTIGTELNISELSSLKLFDVEIVHEGLKEYLDNNQIIIYKDYFIISTTEFDSQPVSYGLFGLVFIPPQVKHELNNKAKDLIKNGKSIFESIVPSYINPETGEEENPIQEMQRRADEKTRQLNGQNVGRKISPQLQTFMTKYNVEPTKDENGNDVLIVNNYPGGGVILYLDSPDGGRIQRIDNPSKTGTWSVDNLSK